MVLLVEKVDATCINNQSIANSVSRNEEPAEQLKKKETKGNFSLSIRDKRTKESTIAKDSGQEVVIPYLRIMRSHMTVACF